MKAILLLIASILTTNSFAQEVDIPQDIVLKESSDYDRYENLVISSVDWLANHKFSDNVQQRKRINAFLLRWLSGSPKVHVSINPEVVTFLSSTPDLISIYLGGWAKYAIENKDYENDLEGIKAGVLAVNQYYEKNRDSVNKDENVEQLIALEKEGKLDAYIQDHLVEKD